LAFIYVHIDDRKQDFVSCDTCKDVLHHKPIDGTSSMMKHQKIGEASKKNIHNSLSIKEYFRPKATQPILKKLKEKIINQLLNLFHWIIVHLNQFLVMDLFI